jgi:Lon protease-like protein
VKPLGLFPLRTVLLPGAALRLHIFEERYKAMIGECIDAGEPFGVVLNRNATETGDTLDPVDVGTTAHIGEVTKLPEGRLYIVTRGARRFHVERIVQKKPFWAAEVSYLGEPVGHGEAATLQAIAADRFTDYLQALLALFGRELESIQMPDDATASSYLIADALQVEMQVKQRLLEAPTCVERLSSELALLEAETTRLRALAASGVGAADATHEQAPFNVRFSVN